jgi:hypothetical protein
MPRPSAAAVSKTAGMPAPVKGWSSQASIAQAEPQTAIVLDNMFPESDSVRSRRGCTLQASGIGASVNGLFSYSSATGGRKLFGANASSIYDCTSIGAVGAAVVTGLTNGKWQKEMFATPAGQYLVICNGADGVRTFDGTTWVDRTASITGTAGVVSTFIQVCAHKSRLWFVADGSTDLWYLPVASIAGAAVKFPVGSFLKMGGKITACATWSSTQGFASDDKLVVITDQGEVLIYAGTDPSSSTTWSIQLRFVLAPPLSNHCFLPIGGDLLILTESGVFPISQILEIDAAALSDKSLAKNIRQAYADAVRLSRGNFGWTVVTLPRANMAIINVPSSGTTDTMQFALNVTTNAWGRFKGWPAVSWEYLDGAIYYGDTIGNVFRAEYGPSDNGAPINIYMLPAFSPLGVPARLKIVNLVRPIISSDSQQTSSVGVAVDYNAPTVSTATAPTVSNLFIWGSSTWGDGSLWASTAVATSWDGIGNVGTTISPAFAATINSSNASNEFNYRVIAFDLVFEVGGVV